MNINFNRSPQPPKGIFAQLLTVIVGAILLGAAFMFSLVFFAVLAIAGVILWLYFWWKTRAVRAQLRKQMQEPARAQQAGEPLAREASAGDIIEGEAVRVVDERDRLN